MSSLEEIIQANHEAKRHLNTAPEESARLSRMVLERLQEMSERQGSVSECREVVAEKAKALSYLAHHEMVKSLYSNALSFFFKSLELWKKIGDKQNEANALHNIASIYGQLSDYPTALEFLYQSLSIREHIQDKSGIASSLNNLGNVHQNLGEYEKALACFSKSLEIREKLNEPFSKAALLNNIASLHLRCKQYEEAVAYAKEAIMLRNEIGDRQNEWISLLNLAEAERHLLNYEDARRAAYQALELCEHIGNIKGQAQSLFHLAMLSSNLQEEESLLLKGLNIAEQIDAKDAKMQMHAALSELYENCNNTQKSLWHYKQYHLAEKSIFNEESDLRAKKLQAIHQVEQAKKEAEIERLKNVELVQALNQAQEANRVKTEVLHVVAHDLQTPVSTIANLAYLMKLKVRTDDTLNDLVMRVGDVSKTMMRQIVNLLQAAAEKPIHQLERKEIYLKPLLSNIIADLTDVAKQQHINCLCEETITVYADEEKVREILENLIGNAMKYSAKQTCITIQARVCKKDFGSSANDHLLISIKDEGQGLTEADKEKLFGKFQRLSARPTGGESSTGVGLYITKLLVEAHGGKIWAESEGKNKGTNKGTTFFVSLPLNSQEN
jgi:signal transduction histidine kinase